MSVAVRVPVGAELQACRMLLPEVANDPVWSGFRLATVGSPTDPVAVVGAVASTPVVDDDGTIATRIALRVARPFRRRGLGRAIVEAIVAEARERVPRLLIRSEPAANPEARPFLEACGFAPVERQVFLTADYAVARERVVGLHRRLEARGAIPAGARIVPLRETMIDRLVELHVGLIGGTHAGIATMLRSRIAAGGMDDSLVLLVDGQPQGLMTLSTRDGITEIASKLVAPTLQASGLAGGWPDLLLMAEGFRRTERHASRTLRFDCRVSNRQTMRLARQLDATVDRTAEVFARATR